MEQRSITRQPLTEEFAESEYRPVSPAAVISVFIGVLAMLAAGVANDLGVATFLVVSTIGLLIGYRGLSSVRRYEMEGRRAALTGIGLSTLALATGFGVSTYQSLYEVPEGCVRINYDLLQPTPGERIPRSAKELDGKDVFIKGYMYPGSQTTGIREFVLCRDNGTCCFGGQPKLTDMIEVKLNEPLALDYNTGLRQVAGKFRVEPDTAPGGLGSVLYHLDASYAR
jgi:Protein of unknown function (DUF3299)